MEPMELRPRMILDKKYRMCRWFWRFLLCFIAALQGVGTAGVWRGDAGISVDLSQYDNIYLAPEGSEQSDIITQILPFVSANNTGGRTTVDLRYQMQIVKYKENRQRDNIYHQLFFDLRSELAKELFFVDFRATNSQSIISGAGRIPQDNISISNNRANVSTVLLTPYIATKVSANTFMRLGYSINKTVYSQTEIINRDSINRSIFFNLRNSDLSANFGWDLSYSNDYFDSNYYSDSSYQQGSVELRLQKSIQFIPFVQLGYENNNIVNTTYEAGGGFWNIGIEWLPTQHTTIRAEKGYRFYGDSSSFSWITESKWFDVGVNYTESVSSSSSIFNLTPPADGALPGDDEILPIQLNPFIRKRLSSNFNYSKSKSTVIWTLYDEKRLSLVGTGDNKISGTTVSWNLLIGRLTNSIIRARWNKIYQDDLAQENILKEFGYTISRQTRSGKSRIVTSLSAIHRRQESELDSYNYRQNIFSLRATIAF